VYGHGLLRVTGNSVVPAFTSVAAQFNHDMLDLSIFFKRIEGHVFADATLFVATMRHFRGEWQVVVHPYRTKLKGICGTHGFVNVARPNGSGQSKDDIISLLQHFLLGAKARYDNDRTEYFTLHNLSIIAILCNNGRFKEEA